MQVSVNDLIMLVLFVPIVQFLVHGASSLTVPFNVLLTSVIVFIVVPLVAGALLRALLLRRHGQAWFEGRAAAEIRAGHDCGAAGDAGADLRLSGGQHHRPASPCAADRGPDHLAGLLQCGPCLRADEVAEGGTFRRRAGRADRRVQLL